MEFGAEIDGSEDFFQVKGFQTFHCILYLTFPFIKIICSIQKHSNICWLPLLQASSLLSWHRILNIIISHSHSNQNKNVTFANLHQFQMFWPTVLAHKIDSDSPLWAVSARQLASSVGTFEVVLTFEGTTPETGNTVQVMQIRNSV